MQLGKETREEISSPVRSYCELQLNYANTRNYASLRDDCWPTRAPARSLSLYIKQVPNFRT
jgi:hypothetical protein